MLARRLMRGRGELCIAASTAASTSNHHTFVGTRKIVHDLTGIVVIHNRADGHLEHNALAIAPRFLRSFAVTAALRLVFGIETEMPQRVVALARLHPDVAALAAVATRGPAAGNKFLAPERHAPVAPVSGLHSNFGFVNKHCR